MAENKKSVIIYVDWGAVFDGLEDDEAGRLIKHFFDYVRDLNPVAKDKLTKIAFEPIKQQLKRDLVKWEGVRVDRVSAGKLGGVKSGEARRSKREQDEANEALALKSKQTQANEAVTVNVIVNDTVNVNDKKNTIEERKLKFATSLEPFLGLYGREMLNDFYRYWSEKNEKGKLKFELSKTWEVNLRLITWSKKDYNNGKSKGKPLGRGTVESAIELLQSGKNQPTAEELRADAGRI